MDNYTVIAQLISLNSFATMSITVYGKMKYFVINLSDDFLCHFNE